MGQSANGQFYENLRDADALDFYDSRYIVIGSLGANVATFLSNPTSANLAAAITNETGTGLLVFNTSPSLVTPSLSGETYSTSAAVTAGTNAQNQGPMTSDLNVITTTGTAPISGATLPTPTVGRRVYVVNKGTQVVNIYPSTGVQIDALGVNAAIRLPLNHMWEFNASSTTQWHSSRTQFAAGSNVVLGHLCMPLATGQNNTAVGYQCMENLTTATDNVAIGFQALRDNTGPDNLALGSRALRNNTGGDNVAFGSSCMLANSTGGRNTGFGREAMTANTQGKQNVAIGYKAAVSFNYSAANIDTNNTFIGAWAGKTFTTGIQNTIIGSGIESATNSPGITTGSYNTIVGAAVVGLATGLANHIVLSDGQGNMRLFANGSGNVGIGTPLTAGSPVISARLHVASVTAPQYRLAYDVNNYLDIGISSAGAVTFDAVGASAGFTFNDDITLANAKNIILNTSTGTKIGTSTTQKLGFWNATPVVQSAAYTVSNYTTDRTIDKSTATIGEITDVLLTLIADLKLTGIIG